jgi:hypothetical protein
MRGTPHPSNPPTFKFLHDNNNNNNNINAAVTIIAGLSFKTDNVTQCYKTIEYKIRNE